MRRSPLLVVIVLATLATQSALEAQRGRSNNNRRRGNQKENGEPRITPQSLVNQGNAAFRQQRFRDAVSFYERALALEEPAPLPANQRDVTQLNLAHTHYKLEDWPKAILAYSRSNADDAMLFVAQAHLQMGNHEEATRALQEVLVRFPDRTAVREQLAQVQSMRGNRRQAATLYRSLIEVRPADPTLHRALASELLALNEVTDAMDSLEAAWRLGKREADIARLLGDLYLQKQMYLEAAAAYARHLALAKSGEAEDSFRIGYAYYLGGEHKSAGEHFTKAVEDDPEYAKGFLYLGNIANVRGDEDIALKEYTRALKADPALADAHEAIGSIKLKRKDYKAAATAFESALACGSATLSVHYNRVVALLRDDRRKEAITALKAGLRAHPMRPQLRGLLSMVIKPDGKR